MDTERKLILHASMHSQAGLIASQAKFLDGIVNDPSINRVDALAIPEWLTSRVLPKEMTDNDRLVDDIEVSILALLGSDGKISQNHQIEYLLVLMTRITKKVRPFISM